MTLALRNQGITRIRIKHEVSENHVLLLQTQQHFAAYYSWEKLGIPDEIQVLIEQIAERQTC